MSGHEHDGVMDELAVDGARAQARGLTLLDSPGRRLGTWAAANLPITWAFALAVAIFGVIAMAVAELGKSWYEQEGGVEEHTEGRLVDKQSD